MGVPSPLLPTGTWSGAGTDACRLPGSGPSTCPSTRFQPAPAWAVPGLTELYARAAPASPWPVVRPPSLGKRLGSSEGVDLPVPMHPILIFLGKINTPNMSALRRTGPAIGHTRAGPSPPISETLDPRKVSLCALR